MPIASKDANSLKVSRSWNREQLRLLALTRLRPHTQLASNRTKAAFRIQHSGLSSPDTCVSWVAEWLRGSSGYLYVYLVRTAPLG